MFTAQLEEIRKGLEVASKNTNLLRAGDIAVINTALESLDTLQDDKNILAWLDSDDIRGAYGWGLKNYRFIIGPTRDQIDKAIETLSPTHRIWIASQVWELLVEKNIWYDLIREAIRLINRQGSEFDFLKEFEKE